MASQRLFIGVDLPADIKAAAAAHIVSLRQNFPHLRVGWEKAEKMHLTLKFLGNVENHRTDAIQTAITRVSSGTQIIAAEISGTGSFGTARAPRVLWLGLSAGGEELKSAAEKLDRELQGLGIAAEDRRFKPHLTIGRIKEPHRSSELAMRHLKAEFGPLSFQVSETCLFKSELTSTGSIYSVLSRHCFGR